MYKVVVVVVVVEIDFDFDGARTKAVVVAWEATNAKHTKLPVVKASFMVLQVNVGGFLRWSPLTNGGLYRISLSVFVNDPS